MAEDWLREVFYGFLGSINIPFFKMDLGHAGDKI